MPGILSNKSTLFLLVAICAAAVCYFGLRNFGHPSAVAWTGAITTLCAVLWISEAIPIPVTSMLPLALFPAVGVLTPAQVGQSYGSPTVLLVMAGFVLSAAMVYSGAHRRVALSMVHFVGVLFF